MSLRVLLLAILLTIFCNLPPSYADQDGTIAAYISSTGTDSGTCNSTASPCRTLTYAVTKVSTGGTLICLSPPIDVSDNFTIRSSITIDCAGLLTTTITIALPSNDSLQTVRLRHLTLTGLLHGGLLIQINAATNVVVEDVQLLSGQKGIVDSRTSPGKLVVKDTLIDNCAGPGIVIAGVAGNAAVIDHVTSSTNTFGVAVALGNHVSITRSVVSHNSAAGIEADGGSFVVVDGSTISDNAIGIQSGSAIRLSNSNIEFNTTAVSGATGTFGNNRFSGNTSDGTALTPVGAGSTDLAQK